MQSVRPSERTRWHRHSDHISNASYRALTWEGQGFWERQHCVGTVLISNNTSRFAGKERAFKSRLSCRHAWSKVKKTVPSPSISLSLPTGYKMLWIQVPVPLGKKYGGSRATANKPLINFCVKRLVTNSLILHKLWWGSDVLRSNDCFRIGFT